MKLTLLSASLATSLALTLALLGTGCANQKDAPRVVSTAQNSKANQTPDLAQTEGDSVNTRATQESDPTPTPKPVESFYFTDGAKSVYLAIDAVESKQTRLPSPDFPGAIFKKTINELECTRVAMNDGRERIECELRLSDQTDFAQIYENLQLKETPGRWQFEYEYLEKKAGAFVCEKGMYLIGENPAEYFCEVRKTPQPRELPVND